MCCKDERKFLNATGYSRILHGGNRYDVNPLRDPCGPTCVYLKTLSRVRARTIIVVVCNKRR